MHNERLAAQTQFGEKDLHLLQHKLGNAKAVQLVEFGRRLVRIAARHLDHFAVHEQQEAIVFVGRRYDLLLEQPLLVDGVGQIANEFGVFAGQALFAGVGEAKRSVGLEVQHESGVGVELGHVPVDLFGAVDGAIEHSGWRLLMGRVVDGVIG